VNAMNEVIQAIRGIMKELEDGWNAGDARRFAAPFAQDADFITLRGEHHHGQRAIEAGHRRLFGTVYRASRARYHFEGIRQVRADVAVAFLRVHLVSEKWDRTQEGDFRPTIVAEQGIEGWKILSFHNTQVAPEEGNGRGPRVLGAGAWASLFSLSPVRESGIAADLDPVLVTR